MTQPRRGDPADADGGRTPAAGDPFPPPSARLRLGRAAPPAVAAAASAPARAGTPSSAPAAAPTPVPVPVPAPVAVALPASVPTPAVASRHAPLRGSTPPSAAAPLPVHTPLPTSAAPSLPAPVPASVPASAPLPAPARARTPGPAPLLMPALVPMPAPACVPVPAPAPAPVLAVVARAAAVPVPMPALVPIPVPVLPAASTTAPGPAPRPAPLRAAAAGAPLSARLARGGAPAAARGGVAGTGAPASRAARPSAPSPGAAAPAAPAAPDTPDTPAMPATPATPVPATATAPVAAAPAAAAAADSAAPLITVRDVPPRAAWALEQAGVDPLLARLYAARGVASPDELDDGLARLLPPAALHGAQAAARLLADALAGGERICVVADYDCDGATACAVALRGLGLLGAARENLAYVVPDRAVHGYGLTPTIVDLALAGRPGGAPPGVLLTVDNGIASLDGVAHARARGLRVVVTDHHLPALVDGAVRLPDAEVIVNPNQPACGFASKSIAGVGVMFYVLLALRGELRERGAWTAAAQPKLDALLDLVALGTVADVVRLDANNRRLVAQGLKRIRAGRMHAGVAALFAAAGRDPRRASAADFGFALGPRLNAAGRLADMTLGIECLLADDPAHAADLAGQLDAINRERRGVEAGMREQAEAMLDALMAAEGGLAAAAGGAGVPAGAGAAAGTSGVAAAASTAAAAARAASTVAAASAAPPGSAAGAAAGIASAAFPGCAVSAGEGPSVADASAGIAGRAGTAARSPCPGGTPAGPAAEAGTARPDAAVPAAPAAPGLPAAPAVPPAVALFDEAFHEGVVGIIASRLKDRVHRPAFVFARGQDGLLKGSGRSIPGFHLRDALDLVAKREPGLLVRFGGHAMAAGCTLAADGFARFAAALAQVAREGLDAATLARRLATDGPLAAEHFDVATVRALDALVWGSAFEAPVFVDVVEVVAQRLVGERHLKLSVRHAGAVRDAIWFGRTAPVGAPRAAGVSPERRRVAGPRAAADDGRGGRAGRRSGSRLRDRRLPARRPRRRIMAARRHSASRP